MNDVRIYMWHPSRRAALQRLQAFSSFMGRHYAAQRNTDFGTGNRENVSRLSPYLRRRLLTEQEVVAAAIELHGSDGAEKFVQEVFWRTYFKGWLERRPGVWTHFQEELRKDRQYVVSDRRLTEAETGSTGIECFDAWAKELVETNYLHNHARMWFASIWIFTLRLPWTLGADFFMRHLLDGDPASNTLSWRWVAGLHTRGKHYVAAPWNIAKFTNNRFAPAPNELAEAPEPLTEKFDPGPALPVRDHAPFDPTKRSVLLLTVEDCMPESLDLSIDQFVGAATLCVSTPNVAPAIAAFDAAAIADAGNRLGQTDLRALDPSCENSSLEWALESRAEQIVTAFVPVGPTRSWLDTARPALETAGVQLAEIPRAWDQKVWPHATAGFFKVKKKIPTLLEDLFPASTRAY